MALAPFFGRVSSAISGHLAVSREDLAASLERVAVGLCCGEDLSPNDAWIAELTTNLLARLYPRIMIRASDHDQERLQRLARAINPEIDFVSSAPPELSIAVGECFALGNIVASASGWVAGIHFDGTRNSGHSNPYAAGTAACLASSELFIRVFLSQQSDASSTISLLNYDHVTGLDAELNSSDVGEVLLVAVGAVGNGAIWALSRDRKRIGKLTIIDHEQLELSNLQRYVLGSIDGIGSDKVGIAKRELLQSGFQVSTFTETLEDYAEQHHGITTPTICISVDSVDSRRAAQALLPKLVVNGWTGEQALGASWHMMSRDQACLACLYHPHGAGPSQTEQAARALGLAPERAAMLWVTRIPLSADDLATAASTLGVPRESLAPWAGKPLADVYSDVVCGAAPVRLTATNRIETVPLAHQSALAGILMAAELVKRTDSQLTSLSQPEVLVSLGNVLQIPQRIAPIPRAREFGCICTDRVYEQAYLLKWENRI